MSTYTANLAAYFTSTKSQTDVVDLESLFIAGKSFTLVKTVALDQYFAQSDYRVYKQIYERIVAQNSFVHNTSHGYKRVREDPDLLYIEEAPFAEWGVIKSPCDLKLGNNVLFG